MSAEQPSTLPVADPLGLPHSCSAGSFLSPLLPLPGLPSSHASLATTVQQLLQWLPMLLLEGWHARHRWHSPSLASLAACLRTAAALTSTPFIRLRTHVAPSSCLRRQLCGAHCRTATLPAAATTVTAVPPTVPLLLLCLSLQAWADAVRRVLPTSKGFRRGAVASTAQLPTPGRLSQLQEEVSGGQE